MAEAGLEDRPYSAWTPACQRVAVKAGFPGRVGRVVEASGEVAEDLRFIFEAGERAVVIAQELGPGG
jgi:hypothetical protein